MIWLITEIDWDNELAGKGNCFSSDSLAFVGYTFRLLINTSFKALPPKFLQAQDALTGCSQLFICEDL